MTLRWLDNNGWQPTGDGATVLIDPWPTRFKTGTYTPAGADPETPISVDTAVIDGWVSVSDEVLVTYGHYGHLPDVPYIARRTGAAVLGTETHCRLLHALGAPPDQLSVVVGGERLRFGNTLIEVITSLHSASGPRRRVAFPGTTPGFRPFDPPPAAPSVIKDLVEGRHAPVPGHDGRHRRSQPRRLQLPRTGPRRAAANVLLLPTRGTDVVDYVPRILDLLGHPPTIIPTHWDDFDLHCPPQPSTPAGCSKCMPQ